MPAVLYPEVRYPDDAVERAAFGPGVEVRMRNLASLADVSAQDAADVVGLMIMRHAVTGTDMDRLPALKTIVRMGVGYDRLDRKAAAARGITICNVPDYGTMEVADHALALTLALRRGIALYHDTQRASPPAGWKAIESPLIRRLDVQTFGVLGLGRIGTAAALRARAFGFRIVFYDPYRPNGADRALGVERVRSLEELLQRSDVLSIHAPLTPETRGMIGAEQLALLPEGAVLINTARGPIVDIDAVESALRSGRLAGAGLDVIPVEPIADPAPRLVAAYRAREPWLEGRLIITPHAAFHDPQSWHDIRVKSAETMAAALAGRPQNVIHPDDF
ncbi:MAG: C-terminal binding protein [Rhodospirillales bacterium]|nr:C-terminal binding protein [Rhodospirillales bacterium]